MREENKGMPPWGYLLGAAAAGAVLGVLFAPKKGSELRTDIKDWAKKRREEGVKFLARMRHETSAKERAQEAIAAVKERALPKT